MKLWICAAAAAVAGLGWVAHTLIADLDPSSLAHHTPDVSGSRARAEMPPLARAARVTATPPRIDEAPPAAGSAAAAAPTSAEVRDRLDGLFRADTVDAAWSQTATRTLEGKLPALLPAGSTVRGVDCRGSLCRIETSHAGAIEYRDFARRAFIAETQLWNGGFFIDVVGEPVPGQPIVTVAYLARDGQSLPSVERLFAP